MALHFEEQVEVRRTPAQCFAFVDDFANTPRWNELCVALVREGDGVVYTYKQGRKQAVMNGFVAERDPPRRLLLEFSDRMFRIEIGFRFDAIPGGTRIEHSLDVEARALLTRIMFPLLRRVMRKQTAKQAQALAAALEA